MSVIADILTWVFLLAGALFTLVGGIGVLRMPDLFTRLHASGVTDMLGAGFLLLGLTFQTGWSLATVKILLLLGFFAVTSPTAAHVVAKCAIHSGLRPWLGDSAKPSPESPDESSGRGFSPRETPPERETPLSGEEESSTR